MGLYNTETVPHQETLELLYLCFWPWRVHFMGTLGGCERSYNTRAIACALVSRGQRLLAVVAEARCSKDVFAVVSASSLKGWGLAAAAKPYNLYKGMSLLWALKWLKYSLLNNAQLKTPAFDKCNYCPIVSFPTQPQSHVTILTHFKSKCAVHTVTYENECYAQQVSYALRK